MGSRWNETALGILKEQLQKGHVTQNQGGININETKALLLGRFKFEHGDEELTYTIHGLNVGQIPFNRIHGILRDEFMFNGVKTKFCAKVPSDLPFTMTRGNDMYVMCRVVFVRDKHNKHMWNVLGSVDRFEYRRQKNHVRWSDQL